MFKFQKKEKRNKSENKLSLIIVFFFFIGIALYLLCKVMLIFVISMIIGITTSSLFHDDNYEIEYKKRKHEIPFYLSFINNFYLYSSLLSSYKQGFIESVNSLGSSHLKDDLTDYLEQGNELPFTLTNSRRENHLKDVIARLYYTDEEINDNDLSYLNNSIKTYQNEISITNISIPLEVSLITIFLPFVLILLLSF